MALTSSSTLAQVEAAYDDNLDYRWTNSVTKAKDFAQAAGMLLRRYQTSISGADGGSFTRSVSVIESALNDAIAYIDANQTTTGNAGGYVLPNFQSARE
ncbi:MAG: hypothetical protein H0W83_07800 [Planctomycetes bacterium]|nr:hypothetical protein [Planctomycetota bacterium]